MSGQVIGIIVVIVIVAVIVWGFFDSSRSDKDWAASRENLANILKGKKFLVSIKQTDGRKTRIESLLIDALVDLQAKIILSKDQSPDFQLTGVVWDGATSSSYGWDFRVSDGKCESIIGTHVSNGTETELIRSTCFELARILNRQTK